ncbi:hypothetical protein GCM10027047_26820 [Rhodococcus aerolatus]
MAPTTDPSPDTTDPVLLGSRCPECGTIAFPAATTCQRCGTRVEGTVELSRRGTVWAHTVQHFAPKSPPYVPPAEGFTPFAVGYVELPDGVRVQARLDAGGGEDLSDAEVGLVEVLPVPRFATDRARTGGA